MELRRKALIAGIAATGNVTISGSTIDQNSAGNGGSGTSGAHAGDGADGGDGGGLYHGVAGSLTLTNVTISGNGTGAGGAQGPGGSPPHPASAGGSGGGLSTDLPATVTNATITGNIAADGSPGTNNMSLPTPAVPGTGGGVWGAATLNNTIVSENDAPSSERNCDGAVLDGDFNISFPDVPESGCPVGFAHGDPLLGSLADNGGDTPTMAITNASSAFDHVPVAGACPATDQRGVTRPQFTQCDAGAFELASTTPPPSGGGSTTPPPPAATPAKKKCKKAKKRHASTAKKKCKKKRK